MYAPPTQAFRQMCATKTTSCDSKSVWSKGQTSNLMLTLLLVRAFKHPSLLLCLLYLRGFQDFGVVGGTAAFITHRMEWIAGGVGVATYYKLIANGYYIVCVRIVSRHLACCSRIHSEDSTSKQVICTWPHFSFGNADTLNEVDFKSQLCHGLVTMKFARDFKETLASQGVSRSHSAYLPSAHFQAPYYCEAFSRVMKR